MYPPDIRDLLESTLLETGHFRGVRFTVASWVENLQSQEFPGANPAEISHRLDTKLPGLAS